MSVAPNSSGGSRPRRVGPRAVAMVTLCLACAPPDAGTLAAEPEPSASSAVSTVSGPSPTEGGAAGHPNAAAAEVTVLDVEVIRRLPHSRRAYTQGLLIAEGWVYESRGRYGESGLDRWDPETGEILQSLDMDPDLFGEGLELVEDALWQLTWQSGRVLRRSRETFEVLEEFVLDGEGWGLAYDGARLVVSDGTHELRFYDPVTFEPRGRLPIFRGAGPQDQLNELEWVEKEQVLYANVFQTDEIVRIDLATGQVTGVADLTGLLSREEARRADVLNGIAFWPARNSFLVTGKYWPHSFEVRFTER